MSGLIAAITAGFNGVGRIADAVEAALALHAAKQQQELGALRQEVEVLRAENSELRTRLTSLEALMARPGGLSGAGKL